MRILICSHSAPLAPHNGLSLPLARVLDELKSRHEVTTVAYLQAGQEAQDLPGIESIWLPGPESPRRLSRIATWARQASAGRPFQMARYPGPIRSVLLRLLEERDFDIVHLHGPVMAELANVTGDVPAVCFAFDAWHLNARSQTRIAPPGLRWERSREEARIQRFESTALALPARVVFVTEQDAEAVRGLNGDVRASVVTNGVDFPASDNEVHRVARSVLFVGNMSWEPNSYAVDWFTSRVWPAILAAEPAMRFNIVGRGITSAQRSRWSVVPGIRVVGEVDDVTPWYQATDIFVCPMMSGTGIKNKLLEAFASHATVVATTVAVQGTDAVDRQHLRVADDEINFAEAVVDLARDRTQNEALRNAGYALASAQHRWTAVANAYERVYLDAVGQ